MLKAVLSDRVAPVGAFEQPSPNLRSTVRQRVQITGRYHEQRDAVDTKVIEPLWDQSRALERGRFDVVKGAIRIFTSLRLVAAEMRMRV